MSPEARQPLAEIAASPVNGEGRGNTLIAEATAETLALRSKVESVLHHDWSKPGTLFDAIQHAKDRRDSLSGMLREEDWEAMLRMYESFKNRAAQEGFQSPRATDLGGAVGEMLGFAIVRHATDCNSAKGACVAPLALRPQTQLLLGQGESPAQPANRETRCLLEIRETGRNVAVYLSSVNGKWYRAAEIDALLMIGGNASRAFALDFSNSSQRVKEKIRYDSKPQQDWDHENPDYCSKRQLPFCRLRPLLARAGFSVEKVHMVFGTSDCFTSDNRCKTFRHHLHCIYLPSARSFYEKMLIVATETLTHNGGFDYFMERLRRKK